MQIIFLKFTDNRGNASQHLAGHKAWLAQGLEDGVFLAAGSLESGLGGAILARGDSLASIQARVEEDPFVRENIVKPEVFTFSPSIAGDGFQCLLEKDGVAA